ncbi:MAG: nitrite reductase, copper-containing [Betaproteobacteria bacterium]|nr:nitrite reductase, copper-containing [Betaproteobacteria bacterium]
MGSLSFGAWAAPVGDPSIFEKLLKIEKVEKKNPGPAAVSIVRDPTEVGTPVGKRGPKTVRFTLETQEVLGVLDASAKTSFMYWTFNGKVPGPLLRARVGDTIEITLKNAKESSMFHSIDLHAVWGQGGGAALTSVGPGEEKSFVFKALTPGLFVYHCATPIIPQHISSGMYGMILIEPEGGLPKVDRELYVMQGDMYTEGSDSEKSFNQNAMMDEHPTYVVMNGSAAALAANPMKVKVGDSVRIFFGVGGPNLTSSFHAIGGIFDKVYNQASLTATPVTDVQTTSVPPGGATMVEFTARVPAKYILVDHAISRLLKGNVAIIEAEGAADPEIFRAGSLK